MEYVPIFILGGVLTAFALVVGTAWSSLPLFVWQLVRHKSAGMHRSFVTSGDIPAMVGAGDVHSYIAQLADSRKRGDFQAVLETTRGVILEISRHKGDFPGDPEDLLLFIDRQVDAALAASPSRKTAEAIKFRKLMSAYVSAEVNKLEV